MFVPDTQLVEGRCPTCGSSVERIAEESYFFKLSAFQDRLRDYYAQHPDFVTPPGRRNEIVAFIEGGLQDLSVSRTSFTWGIPVPDDPAHVMYVWFDALTNYMTAVGYGAPDADAHAMFENYWPADVHLIGKEIVRQHGIYWPAFLMAADLADPEQLVSHGWWLMDGAKMSKSIGNVVKPDDYVRQFGVDALRYFVMREMVFGQDANFTDEAVLGRYNADLANDLGNLVSRAATMIHRYCEGVVPRASAALLSRAPEVELRAANRQPHRPRQKRCRIVSIQPGAARHLGRHRRDEPVYRDARAVGARQGRREARRARHGALRRGRHRARGGRAGAAVHARHRRTHARDGGRQAVAAVVGVA